MGTGFEKIDLLLRYGAFELAKDLADNFIHEVRQYGKVLNASRTDYSDPVPAALYDSDGARSVPEHARPGLAGSSPARG